MVGDGCGQVPLVGLCDATAIVGACQVVAQRQGPGGLAALDTGEVTDALHQPDRRVVVGNGRGQVTLIGPREAAVPVGAGQIVAQRQGPASLPALGTGEVTDALHQPDRRVVVGDSRGQVALIGTRETAVLVSGCQVVAQRQGPATLPALGTGEVADALHQHDRRVVVGDGRG